MTALTVFLIVVTVLLVLGALGLLLVSVWIGRHAVRAGRLVRRQTRAGWSTARAAVPSDARAVRLQRARLERELTATSNAWDSGRRLLDRSARKRLADSHGVLVGIGRRLAFELSIVATDSDPVRREAWLPDLRLRVDAFVIACGHFRQGVLLSSGAYGDAPRVVDAAIAVGIVDVAPSVSSSTAASFR